MPPPPKATLVAPATPPQLVACGRQDFYRITSQALEVFETATELPPSQIRGSRVARQTTEVKVSQPSNVIMLPGADVLVLSKEAVLRYALGEQARRYAPVPAPHELVMWSEKSHPNSFHVHALEAPDIVEYTLPRPSKVVAGANPPLAQLAARATPIPLFDSRIFTFLADGAVLYSTTNGLVRAAGKLPPVPLQTATDSVSMVFPDPSPERYWVADVRGNIERRSAQPPAALSSRTKVPGIVIETAVEADRLAVLSMELTDQMYRPTVTIFSNGRQTTQLGIAPSTASLGQPAIDICLVSGRPWVVVGGPHWLQLLDVSPPRLLAEW